MQKENNTTQRVEDEEKADGVQVKEGGLKVRERRVESEWQMKWKEHSERNDVPAWSGVFGLLQLAYHGNDC